MSYASDTAGSAPETRTEKRADHRWGVILAGGDGTRLLPLTRRIAGDNRPKQFCVLVGSETLLQQTRRRVSHILPQCQTLVALTRTHERFCIPLSGKQMRAFREYDQESGCVAARKSARALRKRIANCKPIDRLAILHVLRVECSGASIKRSRDDE